jgi:hypothetical protein
MNIIRPRYIALDTSHLARLADDAHGQREARRKVAATFMEAFSGCGGILLLSWHHFEELLQHGDSALVARRVAFIQSLPMVATIASVAAGDAPGSVIDILALEVTEAFKQPRADVVAIRDRVAQVIFRCGTGRATIGPYVASLEQLRDEFRRHAERAREIVALSRSSYIDIGKTKVAGWLKGRWRSPEDAEGRVANLTGLLAEDIRQRGDKRIADAATVAARFMVSVRANASVAQGMQKEPSPDMLLPQDVDRSDIGPDTTVDEMGDLAVFRHRLRLVNDVLGLPWTDLRARVTEARLPSGVVQSALRRHRQHLPEWKGSELIDQYLACLAPYADITYVDKRTHEVVTRARRASAQFAAVIRRVEKAGAYADISRQLLT